MDAGRAAVSKSTFTMLTIDETPVLKIAQREAHCNTADIEAPTKLVFAGNRKRGLFISTKYILCYGSN